MYSYDSIKGSDCTRIGLCKCVALCIDQVNKCVKVLFYLITHSGTGDVDLNLCENKHLMIQYALMDYRNERLIRMNKKFYCLNI